MGFGIVTMQCKFTPGGMATKHCSETQRLMDPACSGNLVQPHTNLTEIEAAAQLLWRVGIPPDKVALGFGFYGRSFTLQDPDCSEPGCRFSNASRPGVCTDTGGYLAYYEVQDILDKHSDIKVHHDKTAAVKYFSWDKDQWISFDDKDTFKQKIDWANDIGMSGSLIWASDLGEYLEVHQDDI